MNTDNNKSRYVNMVLDRVKQYYDLKTDAKLSEFLDIQPTTLAMQRTRGTLPINKIVEKCTNVNMNWLLSTEELSQSDHTLDQQVSYVATESLRVQNLHQEVLQLRDKLNHSDS